MFQDLDTGKKVTSRVQRMKKKLDKLVGMKKVPVYETENQLEASWELSNLADPADIVNWKRGVRVGRSESFEGVKGRRLHDRRCK